MAVELVTALFRDGSTFAPDVQQNPRRALSIQKGTQLVLEIDVVTPAGRPVDLTGAAILLEVRKNPEPVTVPALISISAAVQPGAPRGRTRVTFLSLATRNLSPGRYVWGLRGSFSPTVWEPLIGLSPFHIEPAAGVA